MNELQNAYYDLKVGRENEKEPFWIKRLRNILESDIHKNPLGCKIPDTHIKIGKVHLHSFYEAQILFSHPHWVRRFASWLNEKINSAFKDLPNGSNINIIGYETYIEPVLFYLKTTNKIINIQYGIYEGEKYIQSLDKELAKERIRYGEYLYNDAPCIYVCGISSTLSTFTKMIEKHYEDAEENNEGNSKDKKTEPLCLSLIQVFPSYDEMDNSAEIERFVRLDTNNPQRAISEVNKIQADFLVSVKCTWEKAEQCLLCFPEDPLDEKPIIQTSETSVVPVQMIQPCKNNSLTNRESTNQESHYDRIDFFSKDSDHNYLFKDYLYYGHIDRMNHHYKYYIRTGRLVKDIIDCKEEKYRGVSKRFADICDHIRKKEVESADKQTINIIVAPSHFSDKVFPNAINKLVFRGEAHTISFDMNKEYRSSFLAKYSNIAYFLEQARDLKCKLRFYYVDDQLISVETYNRAKSLIKSLMDYNHKKKAKDNSNTNSPIELKEIINSDSSNESNDNKETNSSVELEIFSAVIVLLSRNSNEAKYDYVEEIERYYSFFDISIPSIRNFADSCPVCKLRDEAGKYSKSCTLGVNAKHWAGKYDYYNAVSVAKAKERKEELLSENKSLNDRYMIRFECENELWEEIKKGCYDSFSYENAIMSVIKKHSIQSSSSNNKSSQNVVSEINVEYVISIVKAISLPFLYYREYEKKAALRLVLEIITQYEKGDIEKKYLNLNDRSLRIIFANEQEKYELLVVIVNCLAAMDSTYLLSIDRIKALCDAVEKLDAKQLCLINDSAKEGFYSSVLHAFKRSVFGIGGEAKTTVFDAHVDNYLDEISNYKNLITLLYMENTNEHYDFKFAPKNSNNTSNYAGLLARYESMYEKLFDAFNCVKNNKDTKIPQTTYLQNVFFVYFCEKRGWKIPFKSMDADLDAYLDKEFSEDVKDLTNSETAGIKFADDRCIVRLDLNADYEAAKRNTDVTSLKTTKSSEDIYLVMRFSGESYKAIQGIREMLKYRYSICHYLRDDLKTGNIYASIRAKKGGELLKSDKSLTHNTDRDIKALADQAIYLINIYNPDVDESFKHAVMAVGTYMNRCISYLHTTSIVDSYFTEPDEKRAIAANHQKFINSLQDASSWEKGLQFFEDYLVDLGKGEESVYFNTYCRSLRKQISFTIDGAFTPSSIKDFLKEVNHIPNFVTSATHEAKYALLSFIGIFDTLLLNAIKHSPAYYKANNSVDNSDKKIKWVIGNNTKGIKSFTEDDKVNIVCSIDAGYSEDRTLQYYDVKLTNNTNETCMKKGITRSFFDEISKDATGNFAITINNDGKGNCESTIKVNIKIERRQKKDGK